jgi:hypothetical protein
MLLADFVGAVMLGINWVGVDLGWVYGIYCSRVGCIGYIV